MRTRVDVVLAVICVLVFAACASDGPTFGAPKFSVQLASEPSGAMLYVVEEREFDRMALAETVDAMDLDDHRVGRTSDDAGLQTTLRAYAQVLVGEWDGRRATLRFTPRANGEHFTVHAP